MGFVIGLMVFGIVFLVGVTTGVISMLEAPTRGTVILPQQYRDGSSSNRVAVIPVEGIINQSQATFVRAAVEHILDDRSIKAVVLRVDSPGGGVTASDQIWYQIGRLKKANRPVVASFGGIAASGGYYVACDADEVVAEETTITGSIGVIAQVLTMEGLMSKVGVEPVTLVASGSPEKDVANDIFRSWNEKDREKIMTMLDAAYDTFLSRVEQGRANAVKERGTESVRALANGSIYTARQAVESGLVDTIGYLDDAIAASERLAGLATGSARVEIMREPPGLFGTMPLVQSLGAEATSRLDAEAIRTLVHDLGSPRVMFLMR